MNTTNIFAYNGDGIGPEITNAVAKILQAAGVPIDLDIDPNIAVGERALANGLTTVLPEAFLNKFKNAPYGVMLKAPLGTPKGGGFESINVQVRRIFDLYANIRPAKSIPGVEVTRSDYLPRLAVAKGNPKHAINKLIHEYTNNIVIQKSVTSFVITKDSYLDALRKAAQDALQNGNHKVTLIHKGNIIKAFSLALNALEEVRNEFPSVTFEEMIIDNFCMQMIINPHQFQNIVLPQMFLNIFMGIHNGYRGIRLGSFNRPLGSCYENVDLVLLRENTEDLYANEVVYDNEHNPTSATVTFSVSDRGYKRIFQAAIKEAAKKGSKKITYVHDYHTFAAYDMGKEVLDTIIAENPEYTFETVDVMSYVERVINNPEQFEIIVTTNMLGDILSDLHAGLVGGLGVTGSANVGDKFAMFEAVHGTAPMIAGQNKANPTALLMATIMMLRHIGLPEHADTIELALLKTLKNPDTQTGDLGGPLGTKEFVDAIKKNIELCETVK